MLGTTVSLLNNSDVKLIPDRTNKAAKAKTSKKSKVDLQSQRKKILSQLIVKSYVDNWPYVNSLSAKARMQLLHRLRLVDQALNKLNNRKKRIKKNNKNDS